MLKALILILAINFIGCNSNDKKPKVIKTGKATELERIIESHTNLQELNPEKGLKSRIEFYAESDSLTIDSNENPIPYICELWS